MNFEDIISKGIEIEEDSPITNLDACALIEEAEETTLYMGDELDEAATADFTPAKLYKEYKDGLQKMLGIKMVFKPISIVDGGTQNNYWAREWEVSIKGITVGRTACSIGGMSGRITLNGVPQGLFVAEQVNMRINKIQHMLAKKYDARAFIMNKRVSEEQLPDKDELKPGDRVSIRKNVTKYGGMGGKCVQVKTSTVSVKIDDGPDKNVTFAKSELIGEV